MDNQVWEQLTEKNALTERSFDLPKPGELEMGVNPVSNTKSKILEWK